MNIYIFTKKIYIFGILRIFGIAFTTPTGGTEGVARCHSHGLGMRYDQKIKTKTKIEKKSIFEKFWKSKFLKRKITFLLTKNRSKKKWLFSKIFDFDFSLIFFSHRKKSFSENFPIFFIMYQVQPMQVASPNSPCTASKPGKRTLENPKNHENQLTYEFWVTNHRPDCS